MMKSILRRKRDATGRILAERIPIETRSKGIFSSEYTVSVKQASGENVSLIVDGSLITCDDHQCFMTVTIVKKNIASQKMRVLLPSGTLENGSRWIDVPISKAAA